MYTLDVYKILYPMKDLIHEISDIRLYPSVSLGEERELVRCSRWYWCIWHFLLSDVVLFQSGRRRRSTFNFDPGDLFEFPLAYST